MSHTYAQNVIHVVFSTKERRTSILAEFRPKLWAYVAGICKRQAVLVLAIGGIDDHIHLLIQVPASLALAKAIATIKANSARWANEGANKIQWQEGYGAFSVSASNVPTVVRYIQNQEAHHKKMSFADEFRVLLKKHDVEYDPRFVLG